MAGRPYVLAETNWKTVREIEYEVAILPWGATEAHNLHLPYGTDTMEGEAVAVESARIAWEKGAKCLVLPSVPFGANAQQVDIPHTVNLNTQRCGGEPGGPGPPQATDPEQPWGE